MKSCDHKHEDCAECADIVTRTYSELRARGYTDKEAFLSAVRVLELRHPGSNRYEYFRRVASLLGGQSIG